MIWEILIFSFFSQNSRERKFVGEYVRKESRMIFEFNWNLRNNDC